MNFLNEATKERGGSSVHEKKGKTEPFEGKEPWKILCRDIAQKKGRGQGTHMAATGGEGEERCSHHQPTHEGSSRTFD